MSSHSNLSELNLLRDGQWNFPSLTSSLCFLVCSCEASCVREVCVTVLVRAVSGLLNSEEVLDSTNGRSLHLALTACHSTLRQWEKSERRTNASERRGSKQRKVWARLREWVVYSARRRLTWTQTKSRRDLFRVKIRIIKRIRRAKQLEAFWLASVRHTARHGGKTQWPAAREEERAWAGIR